MYCLYMNLEMWFPSCFVVAKPTRKVYFLMLVLYVSLKILLLHNNIFTLIAWMTHTFMLNFLMFLKVLFYVVTYFRLLDFCTMYFLQCMCMIVSQANFEMSLQSSLGSESAMHQLITKEFADMLVRIIIYLSKLYQTLLNRLDSNLPSRVW